MKIVKSIRKEISQHEQRRSEMYARPALIEQFEDLPRCTHHGNKRVLARLFVKQGRDKQKEVRCHHQGVVDQHGPSKNDADVFRGDGHDTQARTTQIGAGAICKNRCPFGVTKFARHVATTTGSALGS